MNTLRDSQTEYFSPLYCRLPKTIRNKGDRCVLIRHDGRRLKSELCLGFSKIFYKNFNMSRIALNNIIVGNQQYKNDKIFWTYHMCGDELYCILITYVILKGCTQVSAIDLIMLGELSIKFRLAFFYTLNPYCRSQCIDSTIRDFVKRKNIHLKSISQLSREIILYQLLL